uniref:Uncharacterized protein n=1 Tax=Ditylenchus dipsaci TaxID=166011 RepID=A0A915E6U6_9BILA
MMSWSTSKIELSARGTLSGVCSPRLRFDRKMRLLRGFIALAASVSTLKSHLESYHEEVSKAIIQQQKVEKKHELTVSEAFALVLSIPCLSLNIFTHAYVR